MDQMRTLCARCVKDYRDAGFYVIPENRTNIKSPCDLCGRPGFDYLVEERYGKKGRSRNGQS